jgi:hypothetical protein
MMSDRYENDNYLLPPRDIRELIDQKFKNNVAYRSCDKYFLFYYKDVTANSPFLRYHEDYNNNVVCCRTFYYENNHYTVEEFRRILNLLAFA